RRSIHAKTSLTSCARLALHSGARRFDIIKSSEQQISFTVSFTSGARAMAKKATRQEKDSIGIKEIPADVYYGVQTARAVENYPISGMRAHPLLIKAFGMVKKAAAQANQDLGLIDNKRAKAII